MKAKILIVDDDVLLAEYLSELLSSKGYLSTVFNDSQKALNYFRENLAEYKLVISDICMPGMNGDELAREILNLNSNMPIILCSGYCKDISKQQLLNSGVRYFMDKPVKSSNLLEAITELKLC